MKGYLVVSSLFLLLLFHSANIASVNALSIHTLSMLSTQNISNQHLKILTPGAYLIVGVFEIEQNAHAYAKLVNNNGMQAQYRMNETNGLIYVYTDSAKTKEQLLENYFQIRTKDSFKDAWVLTVKGKNEIKEAETLATTTKSKSNTLQNTEKANKTSLQDIDEAKDVVFSFEASSTDNIPIDALYKLEIGNTINLIEDSLAKKEWVFTQEYSVKDSIHLTVEAIGFHDAKIDFRIQNYLEGEKTEYINYKNDTLFVKLKLKSLAVGDYQLMYNTFFYSNATVMRPYSRSELDKVFKILRNTPNLRICLHGHTNGDSRGIAYVFREDAGNFFEIIRTKKFKKRGVSSSKLSLYRAETIKKYLISKGIDASRLETKGWGGKKMIYAGDSPMAKNNIRVEIEVLEK